MTSHWLRDQICRIEDLLRQETQELAQRLLPDLAQLERAHHATGLDFLEPGAFQQNLERQRRQLQQRREALQQDPDFSRPISDSQRLAAAERKRLQEHQAALVPLIQICHRHPRFAQLLKNGYGTGRYATPFWRMSYYADRKAAAELCQLTGKKNFATLLRDYQSANEAFDVLHGRLQDLQRKSVSARQEWESLGTQLETLDRLALSTAQTRLQLALLKGGSCWQILEKAGLDRELRGLVDSTRLLLDQLEELRRQRAQA